MLQQEEFTLTPEEKGELAERNLVAMLAVATKYMQARGMDVEEFWHFVGSTFAPTWVEVEQGSVPQAAEHVAAHVTSSGAEVVEFRAGVDEARLVCTGFPPQWVLDVAGMRAEEAARSSELFAPILQSLGLDYSWTYADGKTTLLIKR